MSAVDKYTPMFLYVWETQIRPDSLRYFDYKNTIDHFKKLRKWYVVACEY